MKAIIVCGGNAPEETLIVSEIKKGAIIIGVDKGADALNQYNIKPHYLIGDFDSIKKETLQTFEQNEVIIEKYPSDKDYTDSQLAVYKAIELGAEEVVLLGCIGTRMDHVLGNIGLLKICLDNSIKAYIKDERNTIFLADKSIELKGEQGQLFSIQSYTEEVKDINIRGAKYLLENYDLKIGDPRTISNVFNQNSVHIEFKKGILIVFYSRD